MVVECEHLRPLLRRYTASNGTTSYRLQCQECGENTRSIKKADVLQRYPDAVIPPWDQSLRDRYYARRQDEWRVQREAQQAERQALAEQESAQWWQQYNEYLSSPAWKERRQMVLERDGNRCQAGLKGCRGRASQVHHRTYDHVFNEPLFDLVAICNWCHEFITLQDRQRRATRAS